MQILKGGEVKVTLKIKLNSFQLSSIENLIEYIYILHYIRCISYEDART